MSEDKSLLLNSQSVSKDDIAISPEVEAILEKANNGARETINSAKAYAKFMNSILLDITGNWNGLLGKPVDSGELAKLIDDKKRIAQKLESL